MPHIVEAGLGRLPAWRPSGAEVEFDAEPKGEGWARLGTPGIVRSYWPVA
jgi:hypothetical protein